MEVLLYFVCWCTTHIRLRPLDQYWYKYYSLRTFFLSIYQQVELSVQQYYEFIDKGQRIGARAMMVKGRRATIAPAMTGAH